MKKKSQKKEEKMMKKQNKSKKMTRQKKKNAKNVREKKSDTKLAYRPLIKQCNYLYVYSRWLFAVQFCQPLFKMNTREVNERAKHFMGHGNHFNRKIMKHYKPSNYVWEYIHKFYRITSHVESEKNTQAWEMVEEFTRIYERNLFTSSKCFHHHL